MKSQIIRAFFILILFNIVFVVPVTADSDSLKLTELFQIISNEGWNQSAVDSANAILSDKTHTSQYWNTFFSGYFSQNPFSNNLSTYLYYPVFGWFDDDVHRNLQNGLTEPLESNILRITTDHPGLGNALQNDRLLFQSFVNSNKFLDEICQRTVVDSSAKQGVFTFYKNYILAYPQYYDSSVTINRITQSFLSVARVQVYLSFKDAAPLTTESKKDIANTLGLKSNYQEILSNYSILVIDNNGLDTAQLAFIDRYFSVIPGSMHNLGSITVNDFINNTWDDNYVLYSTNSSINIFGDKIGTYPENQFPDDISPGITEIFCSTLAHEANHIVEWYYITSSPTREARQNALIDTAGTNHMNYLKSMVEDGYFFTYRSEFFASISNQWFTNSSHVLDLGISRFNRGYKDPINQFIFFADVYSMGSDTTLFYTIDRTGNIINTSIPVFRDAHGHINKMVINNFIYTFTLDDEGNVLGISSAPVPATRVGLYQKSTGTYFLKNRFNPGPADNVFQYGAGGNDWSPLVGDWDGDGHDTIGLYQTSIGAFFVKNTNSPGNADLVFPYGAGGNDWVHLSGDWDGDGRDTVGAYQKSIGVFFLKNTNNAGPADIVFQYGAGGDDWSPLVGDWDGDGYDTIGLYQKSTGMFWLKNSNGPGDADLPFPYGAGGNDWIYLSGDWDGDGRDTVGAYQKSIGVFFLKNTNNAGPADIVFQFGWGGNDLVPIVGRWG